MNGTGPKRLPGHILARGEELRRRPFPTGPPSTQPMHFSNGVCQDQGVSSKFVPISRPADRRLLTHFKTIDKDESEMFEESDPGPAKILDAGCLREQSPAGQTALGHLSLSGKLRSPPLDSGRDLFKSGESESSSDPSCFTGPGRVLDREPVSSVSSFSSSDASKSCSDQSVRTEVDFADMEKPEGQGGALDLNVTGRDVGPACNGFRKNFVSQKMENSTKCNDCLEMSGHSAPGSVTSGNKERDGIVGHERSAAGEENIGKSPSPCRAASEDSACSQEDRMLSEKGKQARERYQSSGYGTGSRGTGDESPGSKNLSDGLQDLVFAEPFEASVDLTTVADDKEMSLGQRSQVYVDGERRARPLLKGLKRDSVMASPESSVTLGKPNAARSDESFAVQHEVCHHQGPFSAIQKHSTEASLAQTSDSDSSSFFISERELEDSNSSENSCQLATIDVKGHREPRETCNVEPLLHQVGVFCDKNSVPKPPTLKNGRCASSDLREQLKSLGNAQTNKVLLTIEEGDISKKVESIQELLKLISCPSSSSLPFDASPDMDVAKLFPSGCSSVGYPAGLYTLNMNISGKLNRTKRCEDIVCVDKSCQEIKGRLKVLENPHLGQLDEEQKDLLLSMYDHCLECGELKCPFYWCKRVPSSVSSDDNEATRLLFVKECVEGFVDWSALPTSAGPQFIKLDSSVPYDKMPDVGEEWMPLCRISSRSRAMLAQPIGLLNDGNLWYTSLVPLGEKETLDWQLKLYSKLRDLRHDNFVKLLWVASMENSEDSDDLGILVCSRFVVGQSLHEYVQSEPFSVRSATSVLLQLSSAAQHLHTLGIVYLNWTSSNVLLSETTQSRVLLTNFSASVLMEEEVDLGYLPCVLPKHLSPPELLSGDATMSERSDMWGLACLLMELLVGKPVWHHCRHEEPHILEQEMREFKAPMIPVGIPKLVVPVFEACWKVNPLERPAMRKLQSLLLYCFQQADATVCRFESVCGAS
ncbi:uncharacterized protein LOC101845767 [Aplysia californica]|uniref:Uncharacterized protein LOC101845767 n=1 Tax=Aplysia californica TaxID=6500 RepID=A0ABM0JLR4_APLCA|nr:uncharacterized protein LOC101845767 [Aplysia californica]